MGLKTNKYLVGIYKLQCIDMAMQDFLKIHKGNAIRVNIRKFRITIDGKEYYFLTPGMYDAWCIGQTYYWGNKLYHSNYEVKP